MKKIGRCINRYSEEQLFESVDIEKKGILTYE